MMKFKVVKNKRHHPSGLQNLKEEKKKIQFDLFYTRSGFLHIIYTEAELSQSAIPILSILVHNYTLA